ncbi:MAG: hypothetical protein Q9227_005613 [Pyrenula ochraceoflavens]
MNNVEDASAEYVQTPGSQSSILRSFREKWPEIMKELEASLGGRQLRFIEQYDPEDLSGDSAFSQPYAFIADRVVELASGTQYLGDGRGETTTPKTPKSPKSPRSTKGTPTPSKNTFFNALVNPQSLSVNVEEVVAEGPGLSAKGWEALADLRDKIGPGEKIGWWVAYNGDPERWFEGKDEGSDYDTEEEIQDLMQGTTLSEEEEDSKTVTLDDPPPKPRILPRRPQEVSDVAAKAPLRDVPRETGRRKPAMTTFDQMQPDKQLPSVS